MRVADLMTKNVVVARSDMSLAEAIHLMVGHDLSGLPVVDDKGFVVGILTEGDLMRRAEIGTAGSPGRFTSFFLAASSAQDYTRTHSRHVSDVMTCSVKSVTEDMPLEKAADIMERSHVRRLPVIKDGRLVGILARADILRAIAETMDGRRPSPATDTDIRNGVLRAFRKNGWVPTANVAIDVDNGVVGLSGTISDERFRAALCTIAENAPGSKGVRDRLVCIEPATGAVLSAMD